jgi:hypothetical protein
LVSVVFVSIYSLFAKTIKEDRESGLEVIAANLAQEGIEIIRNARDENLMRGVDMNSGLSGNCYPYVSGGEANCDGTRVDEIGVDLLSGTRVYENCSNSSCAGMEETEFRRSCSISSSGDPREELEVICTVEWDSFVNPDLTREVVAESYLTNWMEY